MRKSNFNFDGKYEFGLYLSYYNFIMSVVCLFSFEGIEECSHNFTISGRKPVNQKNIVSKQTPNKSFSVKKRRFHEKFWKIGGKIMKSSGVSIRAIYWIILKLTAEKIKWIHLPMSNIRSASSRTRNFKFSKEILSFSTKSIRRPGVLKIITT